jgi:hypothetical protein
MVKFAFFHPNYREVPKLHQLNMLFIRMIYHPEVLAIAILTNVNKIYSPIRK